MAITRRMFGRIVLNETTQSDFLIPPIDGYHRSGSINTALMKFFHSSYSGPAQGADFALFEK